MPLDNVRVNIVDRTVTISWPTCTNVVETMKNYQTTFTYVSYRSGANRHTANVNERSAI